jgi:hypothetical protein
MGARESSEGNAHLLSLIISGNVKCIKERGHAISPLRFHFHLNKVTPTYWTTRVVI